jgi:hypothetical protein
MVSSSVHSFLDTMLAVYSQLYQVFWSNWEHSRKEVWHYFTQTKDVLPSRLSTSLHNLGHSAIEGSYMGECNSWQQQRQPYVSFTLTCNPTLTHNDNTPVTRPMWSLDNKHENDVQSQVEYFLKSHDWSPVKEMLHIYKTQDSGWLKSQCDTQQKNLVTLLRLLATGLSKSWALK